MSSKDYMRINNDKTVTIDFSKYKGNGFVDAVKTRDIAKITILDRKKRKELGRGANDVIIKYASGGEERVSRKFIAENYLTRSGKKLHMSYLKDNTQYMVISNKPRNYAVMMLPANMKGTINGREIPGGYYVVAPKNNKGEIDFNKMTVVNSRLFRKMFKIPPQDIINKNISNRGNKVSRKIHTGFTKKNNGNVAGMNGQNVNIPGNMANKPTGMLQNNTNQNQQLRNNQTQVQQQSTYIFEVKGRLFSSIDNTLVGYLLVDKTGKQLKKKSKFK